MSIYWKVVNRAHVFWLSFNLWPIFCLSLGIGYRRYILFFLNTSVISDGQVDCLETVEEVWKDVYRFDNGLVFYNSIYYFLNKNYYLYAS